MGIAEGDRLPEGRLSRVGEDGIEEMAVSDLTAGRSVVIFAVPGAFTPTCHAAHMPSFIRTAAGFAARGVECILCVAVNDPHVLRAWSDATGAAEAGILVLSDATGAWSRALGQTIVRPGTWQDGRSKRYAMHVVDGVVVRFHPETGRGCEISGGEALLAAI